MNSNKETEKDTQFIAFLQRRASLQAKLHTQRVLPSQLDWLTSFVGRYSWQTLLGVSALVAAIVTFG